MWTEARGGCVVGVDDTAADAVKGAGAVVGDAFNAAITFLTALFD